MKKLMIIIAGIGLISSCRIENEDGYWSDSSFCEGCITNGETYNTVYENPFMSASNQPLSTFGLDPDGGSYANAKRLIEAGTIPNPDIIRIEEFINYFEFDYPKPTNIPVYVDGEVGPCPWAENHKLLRIGIQGFDYENNYPNSNFVLLIDRSGSMRNKIDLVKNGLGVLIDELKSDDRVSIVTYASNGKVLCKGVSGSDKQYLKSIINGISPGGATNGGAGIKDAYKIGSEQFVLDGNNRVVLITDGDFNLGASSSEELTNLIEDEAKSGIYLSAIGVGEGNYNEANMENLALKGNGTYDYLGSYYDAQKIFKEDYNKFFAVAKDVKIQVEFNPNVVSEYRLIGYENRVMDNEDFDNDSTDSGDLNSDQSVTAVYELIMSDTASTSTDLVAELRFRYKNIGEEESLELIKSAIDDHKEFDETSENFKFASGITGFGLEVKNSMYKGDLTLDMVKEIIMDAKSFDPGGHRTSLLQLIDVYENLRMN